MTQRCHIFIAVLFLGINLFLDNRIQAEPEITSLKSTSTILKKEYAHLAPAVGCLWYKASIIENMYRFGISDEKELKQSAPILLIKKLFYLNNDGINFNPMQRASETATHLTPQAVGQIIGTIEKFFPTTKSDEEKGEEKKESKQEASVPQEKEKQFKKEIVSMIARQLDEELKNIEKELEPTKKRVAQYREEIDSLKKAQSYLNDIKEWQGQEKEIETASSRLASSKGNKEKLVLTAVINVLKGPREQFETNQAAKDFITKKIDNKTKEIATLEEQTKKTKDLQSHLKEAKKDRNIQALSSLLLQSIEASGDSDESLYQRTTTQAILLSFMWAKAYTKQDLLDYYQGLQAALPGIFLSTDDYKGIAESFYTEEDYKKLAGLMKENPEKVFSNQDDALLAYFGYYLYVYPIPPQLHYRNDVNYKSIVFPDCGENSVLNFFNVTLAKFVIEQADGKGNVTALRELIKSSSEKPSEFILSAQQEKLLQFYVNYPNPKKHSLIPNLHNEWATVVSELKGVMYDQGGVCEISPRQNGNLGFENLEAIVRQLTGYTIKGLLEKIYTKQIVDYQEQEDQNTGTKKIGFQISLAGQRWPFTWFFYPKHFELDFPGDRRIIDYDKILFLFKRSQEITQNPSIPTWISLFTQIKLSSWLKSHEFAMSSAAIRPYSPLEEVHNEFKFSTAQLYHFLFGQKLKNYEVAITYIEHLLKSNLLKKLLREQIIAALYNHLPVNDEHVIERANRIFLKSEHGLDMMLNYKKHHISSVALVSFIRTLINDQRREEEIFTFLKTLELPPLEQKELESYTMQNQLVKFVNTLIMGSKSIPYYQIPQVNQLFLQTLKMKNFQLLFIALSNLKANPKPFIKAVRQEFDEIADFIDNKLQGPSTEQLKQIITTFFLLIYTTGTEEYFSDWMEAIISDYPETIDLKTAFENKDLIEKLSPRSQTSFFSILTSKIDFDCKHEQEAKKALSQETEANIRSMMILLYKTNNKERFESWISEKIELINLDDLLGAINQLGDQARLAFFAKTTQCLQKQVQKYRELKQEIPQRAQKDINLMAKTIKEEDLDDYFAEWLHIMQEFIDE